MAVYPSVTKVCGTDHAEVVEQAIVIECGGRNQVGVVGENDQADGVSRALAGERGGTGPYGVHLAGRRRLGGADLPPAALSGSSMLCERSKTNMISKPPRSTRFKTKG